MTSAIEERFGLTDPANSQARIGFAEVEEFEGWSRAPQAVQALVLQHGARRVLELGSGANPTLPIAFVREQRLEYTTSDVSQEELAKAPQGYRTLLLDLSSAPLPPALHGQYDFVFSRMVNEHVPDGEAYYRNIFALLSPGGITAHWFSTLYTLPFLINRLLPESWTDRLLEHFARRDAHQHSKFRAYYSWSRGPTAGMIARFQRLGFHILTYRGYFGHYYYARRLGWLQKLEARKAAWLLRHPFPLACSYAHLLLQRPR